MVLLALGFSAFSSSEAVSATAATRPLPAVERFATPAGWVPVSLGAAQLSVPASWFVLYNSPPCATGSPPGEIFVNPRPGVFHCPAVIGRGPRTTVFIGRPTGNQAPSGHPEVVNGLLVYPYSGVATGRYLVPSLEVEITVDGTLGQRVLRTLMVSARAVVLAPGGAVRVPPTWRPVSFGGLRFSVPPDWPVARRSIVNVPGNPCRTLGISLSGYSQPRVSLSTDTRPFVRNFMCARIAPTPYQPSNGVQVDSGLRTDPLVSLLFSARCVVLHGLTACPASSPCYSVLFVRVRVPGRSKPVLVSIGLAGDGSIARTILYSVRAA